MAYLQRAPTRMFTFSYFNQVPNKNQTRVVKIQSEKQWKAYFEASKRNNKLLVVQFTATWCGPCRLIEPAIQEFSATFTDVDFLKIDVDDLPFVADQFEANSLPAFVLIKQGRQVDKIKGVNKIDLQNKIQQHRI